MVPSHNRDLPKGTLMSLLREAGFTREELMAEVWGYAAPGRTRTLDSHACRLRKKLACDTHRLVVNVWGVGMKLLD